jgi:hypothetical protein
MISDVSYIFLRKKEIPMVGSPLPLLIRRARMTVDERQLELAELTQQENKAAMTLHRHDDRQADEQAELAKRPPEARIAYSAWLRNHKRERDRLADLLAKLSRSRLAAQDALLESCAELKRLELADEARRQAERRMETKRAEAKAEEIEMIRRHSSPGRQAR